MKKQIDDATPIKVFLTARMERNLCSSPAALMQINSFYPFSNFHANVKSSMILTSYARWSF
ncbi:MAG: hypothetical protein WBD97_26530, partial [Pseudolabrys sp.]